jgi:transposase
MTRSGSLSSSGENRELRRANEILRTALAFFAAAELDRKLK